MKYPYPSPSHNDYNKKIMGKEVSSLGSWTMLNTENYAIYQLEGAYY